MASDRAEQASLAEGLSAQRASAELLRERHAGKPMPGVEQWLVAGGSERGTPTTLLLKREAREAREARKAREAREARDARPAGAPLPCGVRAGRHRFSAIA